jgi:hypothetical protein
MAATGATHTYGSTIGVGPVGGSFTLIAEVLDISGPDVKVNAVKVTHLTSDAAFHEKLAGLADGGEVTLKLNFIKAQFLTLYGYLRLLKGWKITFADSSNFIMAGFITNIKVEAQEDQQIIANVTVTVTGAPVFAVS